MARKMIEKARARSDEDKEARQQEIMTAAATLFNEREYRNIKILDVAKSAGIAKGTLYLYFPSKESLFTAVYIAKLHQCFEDLAAALPPMPSRIPVDLMADAMANGLAQRIDLMRMMSMLHTVLESAMDIDEVVAFKRQVYAELSKMGETLERHTDLFQKGEGVCFLLRVYAAAIGLYQVVSTSRSVRDALDREKLTVFNLDFAKELALFVRGVLRETSQAFNSKGA